MKNNLFLFLFLFCASIIYAKKPGLHGGTIAGIVTENETNLELPGAIVRLVETDQSTVTNELGVFAFNDLPGGTYTIAVSFVGFEAAQQTVVVKDHETSTMKCTLYPAHFDLADVQVTAKVSNPLGALTATDIQLRPINSAQDILRFVPGVVIAQHAGGGKAEQIFLRGFDIDHGTDIALFADGLPVNMVSHAHGQGYADLHFVIPEMIDNVDFQKGTYEARVGDFATAGFVKFNTMDVLRENFIKLEAGEFNSFRSVAAIDLLGQKAAARGNSAYFVGESMFSDGYFENSQNFKRLNFMTKYRYVPDEKQTLTISLSRFTSSWQASGQIPQRAIDNGQITRFGAIDPNEGGQTGRSNLNVQHLLALNSKTLVKNQFWFSKYDFELFSNFTFFLEDPINGDQIKQKENRNMYGYNGSVSHTNTLLGKEIATEAGINIRFDETFGSELSRTKNRINTLEQMALGDINQINAAAYADARFYATKRLTLNAGLRFDQFHYAYHNQLDTLTPFKATAKNIAGPKLRLDYQATPHLRLFAAVGSGFHSNDSRVILSGQRENIVPRAWGQEVGFFYKPFPKMLLTASAWRLALEQEFVYVGDAGVVEPSGRTLRQGIDVSVRWQMLPWLYFDADYNVTRPRALDVPEGENFVPLAPLQTSIGGLSVEKNGVKASLRYRYLADRPANENNTLTADGWFLLDALVSYAPKFRNGKSPLEISLSAQNLTNTEWKEAQFETESRLKNEPESVTEIHFTPGTPFWMKGAVTFKF